MYQFMVNVSNIPFITLNGLWQTHLLLEVQYPLLMLHLFQPHYYTFV